jgi:hypothetical protein
MLDSSNSIEQQIKEAINYHDNQLAWSILVQAAKQPEIKLSRQDYLQLSYLRMSSLDAEKLLSIIQESVLAAFAIPDFDLEAKIADYVEALDYVPAQVDFIIKLKSILVQHEEVLGAQKITLGDKAVTPTIANWIADFELSSATKDKGALGELRYVNTGQNSKLLTPEQREVLKRILNLYDRLAEYESFWNELPEKLPEADMVEFENYIEKQFALAEAENIPVQGIARPVLTTEAVGEPIPEAGIFTEQVDSGPEQEEARAPQPSAEQRRIMQDIAASAPADMKYGTDNASIHDIINRSPRYQKRGIVLDGGTNIKVDDEKKRLVEQREQKATDIQSKLEELRKRNKDNA